MSCFMAAIEHLIQEEMHDASLPKKRRDTLKTAIFLGRPSAGRDLRLRLWHERIGCSTNCTLFPQNWKEPVSRYSKGKVAVQIAFFPQIQKEHVSRYFKGKVAVQIVR